ncbi:hypothetical protein Tco_0428242 [Tanacetum coccineum]
MPISSSNDMVHNHYLDEARKKTQERDRNSKTSVMPSTRIQSTPDGSKPKPRSTNQTTRNWPASKSSCITITDVPKADHSRNASSFSDSKHFVQSNKTRNNNKPLEQKSHTQKPDRQIFTGHRFSPNKTSAMYEKTSPRSDLRWKPTGTSINVQKEQSFNSSAGTSNDVKHDNLIVWLLKKLISQKQVLKWILN